MSRECFDYLNALQPGISSVDDIRRAVAAARSGTVPEFADLPDLPDLPALPALQK